MPRPTSSAASIRSSSATISRPRRLKPLVDPSSPTFDPAYARALDRAVSLILYEYQRFGRLDDSSYPAWAKTHVRPAPTPAPFDEQAGITLARKLAEETGVLLKNTGGVLPLSPSSRKSVAVIGPTADVLPAAAGTERSRGVGQRTTISPLDVLRARAGRAITYAPGIDRIGTTVPAAAFHTSVGGPRGLTRTEVDPSGAVVGTQVDAALAGNQRDLTKGNTYTWNGFVTVPAADTYTLWLQRPAGTVVGSPSGPNGGVNPGYQAGPFTGVFDSASLSIDGTAATLRPVSTLHPNDYKGGPTFNGQYLGLNVVGAAVPLTPGPHQISITYATSAKAATAPTLKLAWAPQHKDLDAAAAAAAKADTAVVFVDDADTTTAPGDVSTLGPGQDALIQKIAAADPRTVVVLNTGAAVQMPWLGRVKGVLEMWFPGQEGGTATANLLLGQGEPRGQAADHVPGRQRLHALCRAPGARHRCGRPDRLVRGPADRLSLVSGQRGQAPVPLRLRALVLALPLRPVEGRAARTEAPVRSPCPSGCATPGGSPAPRCHRSTCRCRPRRGNRPSGWSDSSG